MPRLFTWWWVRLIIGLAIVIMAAVVGQAFTVGVIDGIAGETVERGPAGIPIIAAIVTGLAALLAYAAHLRWVERKPQLDIRLRGGPFWNGGVELLAGCLIGFGLMAAVAAVLGLTGAYTITAVNPLSAILPALAIGIYAGVVEEIILRGLIFRLAEEWMGSIAALVLSSLIFGFGHAMNDNATLFSSVAITLEAGLLLGLAYMFTRRLWLVIGLHMAWNTSLGGLFGMPVSGYALPSILEADVAGPDLLTGGAFGPEASLTAILICGMATAAFAWGISKRGEWRKGTLLTKAGKVATQT